MALTTQTIPSPAQEVKVSVEQPRAVTAVASLPPFRMSPTRTFSSRWLKILIYGSPGMGKSTLAGSSVDVPAMRDVLLIDAESGDLALQDNPRVLNPDEITHVRVSNFMTVAHIQTFLKAHCIRRDANDIDGMRQVEANLKGVAPSEIKVPRKFRTVIIDSLSEVEAYCMYGLLKYDEGTILTGASDEIDVARFDEFRKNNMMVNTLVRALRDLPMHVIFTCGQQYTQDEMKRFHYSPQLTGKLAIQVQGFLDVVGFLRAGTAEASGDAPRRLFVQPIERFSAKNRRASFKEAFLENPTMLTMMQAFGLETK